MLIPVLCSLPHRCMVDTGLTNSLRLFTILTGSAGVKLSIVGDNMISLDGLISLKYDWEHDYLAAILETDNEKLKDMVATAESTLLARVDQLNTDHGGSSEERSSLTTALSGLRKLRSDRLGTLEL